MRCENGIEPDIGAHVERETRSLSKFVEQRCCVRLITDPAFPEHLVRDPVIGVRPEAQGSTIWESGLDCANTMEMFDDCGRLHADRTERCPNDTSRDTVERLGNTQPLEGSFHARIWAKDSPRVGLAPSQTQLPARAS